MELDEEPDTGVFRVSFRLFFNFRAAVTVFLLPFAFFVLKFRTGLNDRKSLFIDRRSDCLPIVGGWYNDAINKATRRNLLGISSKHCEEIQKRNADVN